MFQLDEKVIADNRSLVTIQDTKNSISPLSKNGTIHYEMETDNLFLTTPKIRSGYINRVADLFSLFDKIVIARHGTDIDSSYNFIKAQTFNENVTIKKDLTVTGNLYVEGDKTIVNTATMAVEDNIVELNKNETGAGISLKKAGLSLNRGTLGYSRLLFNEDEKGFVLDTNATIDGAFDDTKWVVYAHTANYGSYKAGDVRVKHKLYVPFADITDTLNVANQANFKNTTVTGTSSFAGAMVVDSTLNVKGLLTAESDTVLSGLLTANKTATFKDNVTIEQKLTVNNGFLSKALAEFNNGLRVTALGADITGGIYVNGSATVTSDIHSNKNIIGDGDLSIVGKTTTGTLQSGASLLDSLDVTNKTTTKDLHVNNNTTIEGILTLTGLATLNGGLTVNGSQTTINTISQFNKDITGQGADLILHTSVADGTKGNLTVGGTTSLAKTLKVTGTSEFVDDVTFDKNILVSNTASAKSFFTSTNYRLTAGDGNGINFWDSNNYRIYMATTGFAGAGKLDSTSDYNMYFRMGGGGVNRGFVFQEDTNNIAQLESTGKFRTTGEHYVLSGGTWQKVLHKGDMGPDKGLDADTLDGFHCYQFLRSDKDTDLVNGKLSLYGDGDRLIFNKTNTTSYSGILFNSKANSTSDLAFIRYYDDAANYDAGQYDPNGASSENGLFVIGVENDENNGSNDTLLLKGSAKVIVDVKGTTNATSDPAAILELRSEGILKTSFDINGRYSGDVDTVDGKHSTDLLLLDGTQTMTGDLNLGASKLRWLNNDYISYSDADFALNGKTYKGKFSFTSDDSIADSVIEAGAVTIGNVRILNNADNIVGVKELDGAFGQVFRSIDEWLRINDDGSHASGVYFGTSITRTDGTFQVGNNGSVFTVDNTSFKYKGNDVLTSGGGNVTGNLNLYKNKITFNPGADNTGTTGIGLTDYAYIYGYHDADTENSKIIFEIGDNPQDGFVFITHNGTTAKNSIYIDNTRVNFADTPAVNGVEVLLKSDMGTGNAMDADTVDGKHAADFLSITGGTATGTIGAPHFGAKFYNVNTKANPGTVSTTDVVNNSTWYGMGQSTLVIPSTNGNTTGSVQMAGYFGVNIKTEQNEILIPRAGDVTINNSKVWTAGNDGTGSGLDADLLDGQQASAFATSTHNHDTTYVKRTEVDLANKYQIKYNTDLNSLDFMYIG